MSEDRELPEGWVETTISKLAHLVTGSTPSTKKPNFYGGNIPFIKPGDLDGEHPLFTAAQYVTVDGANAGRLLPQGSILVSCIGNLGKTALLGRSAICNQQINAIVVPQACSSLYIYYYFQTLRSWMKQNASATTVSILNKSRFGEAPVSLPPLNEQNRIVDKIEALQAHSDAAQASLDAIPPLLEKLRQSVLAAAFRGDLTRAWREQNPDVEPASVLLERIRAERKSRFIEDEAEQARAQAEAKAIKVGKPWGAEEDERALAKARVKAEAKYVEPEPVDAEGLPELPEGWCWASVGEIVWSSDYGISNKCSYTQTEYPVLRIPNITQGSISLNDLKFSITNKGITNRNSIKLGDFLFIRTNGSKSLLGRGCLVEASYNTDIYFASYLIRLKLVYPDLIGRYFSHLWTSFEVRRQIESLAISSAGQNNFSMSSAFKVKIPLPPEKEIVKILETLADRSVLISQTDLAFKPLIDKLSQLNQSILAKAFRGELVSQDPTDEPASVLLERIRQERAEAEAAKKGRKGKRAKASSTGTRRGRSRKKPNAEDAPVETVAEAPSRVVNDTSRGEQMDLFGGDDQHTEVTGDDL